jgi:hypothetical protein
MPSTTSNTLQLTRQTSLQANYYRLSTTSAWKEEEEEKLERINECFLSSVLGHSLQS